MKMMLESKLTPERLSEGTKNFEDLAAADSILAWTQALPAEGGRYALHVLDDRGCVHRFLSEDSLRTRIHEYGGGAIACDGTRVFAVCDSAKAVKEIDLQEKRVTTLLDCGMLKVAELCIHPSKPWIFFVAESEDSRGNTSSALYRLDRETKKVDILTQGFSFYMSPTLSQDGQQLAFVCWDDPYMSWQRSAVCVASLSHKGFFEAEPIAVGPDYSSNLQPCFSADGTLFFVSDISGFWSIMAYKEGAVKTLYSREQDCTFAHWKLGRKSLAFFHSNGRPTLACIVSEHASDKLMIIDCTDHRAVHYPLPFTAISHLTIYRGSLAFFAGSALKSRTLISIDMNREVLTTHAVSCCDPLFEELATEPVAVAFAASLSGRKAEALYYPPSLTRVKDLPLGVILRAHGGPTGIANPALLPEVLFWTSRGFAFCDVNYTGSTGFGRDFRAGLDGYWGERDAADCITCAKELVARGLAKEGTIFIRGSSAGGYTALMAASCSDLFAGVISYYGIADLSTLLASTHRFEKYYLSSLAGTEDKKELTRKSPVSHADTIMAPVLLLQGKEDPVVPAVQAEDLYLKLKERGKKVHLVLFDKEGHGFRRKESIVKAFTSELAFVREVLGL